MEFSLWVNITIDNFNKDLCKYELSKYMYEYYRKEFHDYCLRCIYKFNDVNYDIVDDLKSSICIKYNTLLKYLK